MKSKLFKTLGIMIVVSILYPSIVLAAEAYPTKPVRIIVPFPAGGTADRTARPLAAELSERFGKQFIVENRGGAGSIIGTEVVARKKPDGYTLILSTASHCTVAALQKLPYDPIKSFTPIAMAGTAPLMLLVHPSVPANSVKELIALAKQKPGQVLFGASGMGAFAHLGTELFTTMADIEFKLVQFKGTGPSMIELIGGHIDGLFCSLTQALSHIKSGKVRVLGTGGLKRSVMLPDVPTIAEAGLPGYKFANWCGIQGPGGMPAPIVDRLNKELKAILASDEMKKRFLSNGFEVGYLGPAEFATLIQEELTIYARIANKLRK
ncbi:Bug family tripartite tricarboxylate transporter substrate binding protein, partial [Thermodesulfobacteriota bacterium]